MAADRRIDDWLDSGVVAITGLIPPGSAATQARGWAAELEGLSAAWGSPVRVDGAALLAERAALTGAIGQGNVRVGSFVGNSVASSVSISVGGACRLLPSADGWVAVSLPRRSDLQLVAPLVQAPVREPWAAVREWASGRAAADVVARARLLGLAVSRVGEGAPPLRLPPAATGTCCGPPPFVVDFSALWAGPLCASLLGLAGTRVIKVESVARLDGARRGGPRFYDLLHAGHASVCIDPQAPADRAFLRALVARADIVIESSRPRALAGWGLSATDAAARGTVWVSITAYGRGEGDRVGFGDDVAAGAGLLAWNEGGPIFVGDAIADPLTGLAAAVAALRALAGGGGQLIDLAMASVAAAGLDGNRCLPAAGLAAAAPSARVVNGTARAAGADTRRIVAELAR